MVVVENTVSQVVLFLPSLDLQALAPQLLPLRVSRLQVAP